MPESILNKMSKVSVLRKWVGKPFTLVNEWVWNRLPFSVTASRAMRSYGAFMNALVKLRAARKQNHGTFFLRNRPELELIRALSNQSPQGSTLRITVLGLYSPRADRLMHEPVFDRLTDEEMRAMFEREVDRFRIKSWIKEEINWRVMNAEDPALPKLLGRQDIVVANRFLCHMAPLDAERCLRNVTHLVKPGGYLFVSGIDLDIRTKVALDLGWTPVLELLEEIHNGDPSVRRDWPWKYWGLEPFNSKRPDWSVRYAAVFQLGRKA